MFGVADEFGHLLDLVVDGVVLLHKDVALGLALLDQVVAHVDVLFHLLHEQVLRVLLDKLIEAHLRFSVAA